MGDALDMPSVPFRLAVVSGCVLAFGLSSPALADKNPNEAPPPGLAGLVPPGQSPDGPPGQSSGGAQGGDNSAQPQYDAPSASGGSAAQTYFTPKSNKGKGNAYGHAANPEKGEGGGQPSFLPKQAKQKDASPSSTPVTVTTSTTPSTPAGGTSPTPPTTVPITPGGSVAAPKHHRRKRATHHTRRAARPSHAPSRSAFSAAGRLVTPLPAAVAPAHKPAPAKHKAKKPGDSLDGVQVSVVTRTVHDIVKVIPGPVKAVIGAMAALLLAAIAAWTAVTLRARRLRRHRSQLLQEVGLLQAALLPEVPEEIGPLAASVAYRPADGPGAGGDFYDVFQLESGEVGLVLGDVAGHGREALARTALLRYTLRAYLETGLEPRTAMRLAGETLEHNLGAGFATAAIALYDPESGSLTYSCAGHPPPILLGPPEHEPVIVCSAPPIGVGERTGIRQTTVELPVGSIACFFTDGLAEARVNGELFGRERLVALIAELGPEPTASELIERIRAEVQHMPDDMAACLLRPVRAAAPVAPVRPVERTEELELRAGGDRDLRRFLAACGISPVEIGDLVRSADTRAEDYGGAVVRVKITDGERPHVSLVLPLVETLESAARR